MAYLLSPLFNDAQFDSAGDPLVGGKLYWYQAGTTTPATVYADSAGSASHTNPIILDARGEPADPIYLDSAASYKAVLKDADDVTIRTIDGIDGIGASGSGSVSEWAIFSGASTYIDADEFSVAGDQTSTFHVGRRVRIAYSGGYLYGTILASAYASATTIQVKLDSGSLDGTIGVVSYGVSSAVNSSVPVSSRYPAFRVVSTGDVSSATGTVTGWTEQTDSGGHFSGDVFTAPLSGYYLFTVQAQAEGTAGTGVWQIGIRNITASLYLVAPSSYVAFTGSNQYEGQGSLSASVVAYVAAGHAVGIGIPTLPIGLSVSSGIVFSGCMLA